MAILSGIGRLGQEPRMQYTPQGTAMTFINLAINSGYGDNKKTTWISLASFGKQAEILNEHLSKGMRLSFAAELTDVTTYEKKSGDLGVQVNAKVLSFDFIDYEESGDEPEEF
jgi:single-strand DNA-binding protein